jgi:predicted small metal-binding protein
MHMQEFCCRDCGLDCSFQVSGMNEVQVAQKILRHLHTDHGIEVISADVMMKIKHSITARNTVDTGRAGIATELLAAR